MRHAGDRRIAGIGRHGFKPEFSIVEIVQAPVDVTDGGPRGDRLGAHVAMLVGIRDRGGAPRLQVPGEGIPIGVGEFRRAARAAAGFPRHFHAIPVGALLVAKPPQLILNVVVSGPVPRPQLQRGLVEPQGSVLRAAAFRHRIAPGVVENGFVGVRRPWQGRFAERRFVSIALPGVQIAGV